MKNLIVCFDGTWNNPDQEENGIPAPTNVFKIFNAIDNSSGGSNTGQLTFYHPGLGGEDTGLVDSITGGAFGKGIRRHISSGYHWLASNYEEGDHIYLFGFSRGAFTARSLGGMLTKGLLDLRKVSADDSWERVKKAFVEGYRKENAKINDWADTNWAFFNGKNKTPIHFLGVWDTVGALGIPDDLEVLNFFDDKEDWQFHDVTLGDNVTCARHAMAIDEVRTNFSVTRWTNAAQHNNAIELWFPGVHADVGGGYAECDLSNGALNWMMEESKELGLRFRDGINQTIIDNPLGIMHNSYKGVFSKLRSRPRNVAAILEDNKQIHSSAIMRQKISPIEHSAYHPTRVLKKNDQLSVDIFAGERWNATHVYLMAGHKYIFKAVGKWRDSKDTCDWKGTENDDFTTGDVVRSISSFLGQFETLFKRFSKNTSTDFLGTKRVENLKWFTMVGAITNDAGKADAVSNDGSAESHQYVELSKHENTPLEINNPGYLYCFPNDVWSLYGNNTGSIKLTIIRVE